MKQRLVKILLIWSLSFPLLGQAQHFDDSHFYGPPVNNNLIDHSRGNEHRPWQVAKEADYISKAQAIDIARHRTNGKILSAHLVQKNKHAFYKIKVLTDSGRIKTLRINAQAK